MKLGAICSLVVALVVGGSAYALAGGSGSSSSGGGPSGAAGKAVSTDKVRISDFKYVPPTIEVKAGTKITFTQEDSTRHTATARQGEFDTGDLDQGDTGSITVESPAPTSTTASTTPS